MKKLEYLFLQIGLERQGSDKWIDHLVFSSIVKNQIFVEAAKEGEIRREYERFFS
ncbi:hypothetical protein ANAPH2_00866 [Anaplasma phagocytophilum]|nr:hypothetical protein ANAPH2_00866 [Anaplasma phagocytophilum]